LGVLVTTASAAFTALRFVVITSVKPKNLDVPIAIPNPANSAGALYDYSKDKESKFKQTVYINLDTHKLHYCLLDSPQAFHRADRKYSHSNWCHGCLAMFDTRTEPNDNKGGGHADHVYDPSGLRDMPLP